MRKKRREGASIRVTPWNRENRKGIKSRPMNLGKPINLFDESRKPSWFNDKVWGTESPRVIAKDGERRSGPPTIGRTMDISKKVDLFGGSGRKPSWFNDSVWTPRGRNRDSDFDGVPDRKDCNPRNPWLQDEDKGRVFVDAHETPTGENFEEVNEENEPYEGTQELTVYEPQSVEERKNELEPQGEIPYDNINDEFTYSQELGEDTPEIKQVNSIPDDISKYKDAEFEDDTNQEDNDGDYWYLYYRLDDGKWYLDNAYTEAELQEASQRIANYPGVAETRVSKEDILKQLNRKLGLKNVGDTLSKAASKVGDYTERQQFKSNLQQQVQNTRRNYQSQRRRPPSRTRPTLPPRSPMQRMQPQMQPNINIYQERTLPPNGNGVGRVQPYSPVTYQQSTVPRVTRRYQPFGANQTYQNPNYDMGVRKKVRGLHQPNPMSVNLASGNSGTGLGRKTGGNVTRPKFMIPMGDIKFLRFGRRLE